MNDFSRCLRELDLRVVSWLTYGGGVQFTPTGGSTMIYATAPNGDVCKRRTDHAYSWAVLAYEGSTWKIKSCSRSQSAAQAKYWQLAPGMD